MIAGLISIGTNSTRALAARIEHGRGTPLLHRSTGTRIGEGLKECGHLDEAAMQRTLDAVAEHHKALCEITPDIRAIATSALRRADNAQQFANRVREITGAELQIVSGDDEARYAFTGAVSGLSDADRETFGVLDTGGGSTEYAAGTANGPERIVSCEIGAVRLTEELPQLSGTSGAIAEETLDRARARADAAIAPIGAFPRVGRLLFVGGTATTIVSMLAGNRDPFPYAQLRRADLQSAIERLRDLDLPARRSLPGVNPQRADILLGGAIVLEAAFGRTLHDCATVSANDLLLGFLLQ